MNKIWGLQEQSTGLGAGFLFVSGWLLNSERVTLSHPLTSDQVPRSLCINHFQNNSNCWTHPGFSVTFFP